VKCTLYQSKFLKIFIKFGTRTSKLYLHVREIQGQTHNERVTIFRTRFGKCKTIKMKKGQLTIPAYHILADPEIVTTGEIFKEIILQYFGLRNCLVEGLCWSAQLNWI